ncbi:hypothetical protein RN001_011501 [Aquatica leii]|uniref:Uncharacterized protein n=1 Tax=Aquatica leii TaxID=1421715 RepID=A0AAN7P1K8_9COLE|nr:hypothetical protein RN001_011501 [Aquatica leii]
MSKKTCIYVTHNLINYKIIRNRELGLKQTLGYTDDVYRKVYSSIDSYQSNIPLQRFTADQGAIFNLEFSLDGRLLVAACEERSVLLFDASDQRQIKKISEAHCSCVNCVRFLDTYTFATCSDDNTVKLWDTRKLKNELRTYRGHANWVKNIEYLEKEKIMITSAFDGNVYAWDLKNPSESNLIFNNVFVMNGLMRTKLTPDGSKMIICTTSGYIIIIHDLNLSTLSNDLKSFRPNLYRLMQLSDQTFPSATVFNHLFNQNRKSNRLEFIDDFPNEAEVISSLQIHPMGWCALSRSITADENEEWTSVHDIQTREASDYTDAYRYIDEPAVQEEEEENSETANRRPTDIWMGFISNDDLSTYRNSQVLNIPENIHATMGIINSGIIGHDVFKRHFRNRPEDRNRIILNLPRLTHFIKEKSVGKGYIKELCFSSDGRIICSPYDTGIRLLGFNEHMQEMCYCVPNQPKELYTIAEMNNYHPDVVVSCKFNPRHYQMVSGCLGGEIVWYKPIL